jgi:predicted DNA binding CopG/RHH family protein
MEYKDLLKDGADETEIQDYLSQGDAKAITIRIPENLRDSAKQAAELRGMSFSAYVRTCLISDLSKRDAR